MREMRFEFRSGDDPMVGSCICLTERRREPLSHPAALTSVKEQAAGSR